MCVRHASCPGDEWCGQGTKEVSGANTVFPHKELPGVLYKIGIFLVIALSHMLKPLSPHGLDLAHGPQFMSR